MSLHPQDIAPIPEETRRVAGTAFPKGNIYLRMRDQIGTIFNDPMLRLSFRHVDNQRKAHGVWL